MNDPKNTTMTGTLIFDEVRNCMLLEGHELSRGENIEICVFGSWIPGQVAIDTAGWYLVTLDQVGIRLHSGLLARSCDFQVIAMEDTALQPVHQDRLPTILIVDDDSALLLALPRTISLRLPDVRVETASSAREALKRIEAQRFDVIVSDIRMPEMDGLALLAKIQELQPETPTILITGHGEHNLAIQALRGGAYDYIQKPIERDNFVAALMRAIQTCQLRRQVVEQKNTLEVYARSLEKLVQQRTQELAEAHTAKDKVISLVSHEMHEPITRLKELMHILRQKLGQTTVPEIVIRSFGEIEHSIARTEELTQELVTTSDLDTQKLILHRHHSNLIDVFHVVCTEEASSSGRQLAFQDINGAVEVDIDQEQMQQVFRTLLMSTRSPDEDGIEPVTVTVQCSAHEVIVAIRDHIAQASLNAGFFIARKTIERHGGRMEVQSFPHDRRTLFVMLPVQSAQEQQQSAKEAMRPRTHAVWTLSVPQEAEPVITA